MELRITFEPGAMQSLQAASYFNGVIAHTVEPWLERWGARTYAMDTGEGAALRWRIWSEDDWSGEELSTLFVWLLILREDIERLQERMLEPEAVAGMVSNWLAMRHDGRGFFLEESVLDVEGHAQAEPRLTLGVLEGRTVMISTDELMFTGLSDGLFGLAVAGRGSYLVEDAAFGMNEAPLRKAS